MAMSTGYPGMVSQQQPHDVFGAEPDRARFVDPFADTTLSRYLSSVIEWHGYIRFLGLPHLRENPDVAIDRLYVEPRVAERWISPDAALSEWAASVRALDALVENGRVVLLGDPGSGKSTLVSWLSFQLARQSPGEVPGRLGHLVPVPMVVRELMLGTDITWDSVLTSFLEQPMTKSSLDSHSLREVLARGQALVMLDGLDEIASIETRRRLRDAVIDGMTRYPACRWLLTSRIVGYDAVPFHRARDQEVMRESPAGFAESAELPRPGLASVRYVAPFDDEHIGKFAQNWYAQREPVAERAAAGSRSFVTALQSDQVTLRLARTPNLLTMMALVYRVRARLPHGRALLYEEITQAYLQSIDEFRNLPGVEYPLAQKRRWLARVGFEMQRRRSSSASSTSGAESREILVDEVDVRHWVAEAMGESGAGRSETAAADFVDYIARRSGLLLPRGAGVFTFLHLSFQEYFAAYFLADQVMSPAWLRTGAAAPGADRASLVTYARDTIWRETLLFLFELLADKTGWPQMLAEELFGASFEGVESAESAAPAVLLARLAINPHSGFTELMREQAIDVGVRWDLATQDRRPSAPEVFPVLFSEPDTVPRVWEAITRNAADTYRLTLDGSPIVDAGPLATLTHLQELSLAQTSIEEIAPLSGLTKLVSLNLRDTRVGRVEPLAYMKSLKSLVLSGAPVENLMLLSELSGLESLYASGTRLKDLRPLSKLEALESLSISSTPVDDYSLLRHLKNLTWLLASWKPFGDFAVLMELPRLKHLLLAGRGPSQASKLSTLVQLETLELYYVGLADVSPLAALVRLRRLNLIGNPIIDISPLASLANIESLDLSDTLVTDVRPLQNLSRLQHLDLRRTPLEHLGDLPQRPGLTILR